MRLILYLRHKLLSVLMDEKMKMIGSTQQTQGSKSTPFLGCVPVSPSAPKILYRSSQANARIRIGISLR